jgi:iron complex transport system substrate-binding protein
VNNFILNYLLSPKSPRFVGGFFCSLEENNMKKWQHISTIGLASMLLLAACGEEDATSSNEQAKNTNEATNQAITQFPITLTDAIGKEVTVEKAPERIVSLIPSNTEILFGLGLNDEIVGVNDNDNYPPEAAEKEKVGGIEYNLEQIIALQPDLVFAHESSMFNFGEEAIAQLEAIGIPVFVVKDAKTFKETYTTIEQMGQLTGKTTEAKDMIASIQQGILDMEAKVVDLDEKSVFIVVGTEPDLYAAGQETFIDEMLDVLNVENVVPELGWPQYSAEQFVKSNADVILVTYENDIQSILTNSAYSEMDAVKSGNVKLIDGDTTSRQGPRIVEGIESIAEAIYPEVFND